MSVRLKTIQEQRGAKVKELDAIFKLARAENRTLKADEATKYDGIETEVLGFDVEIDRELRQIARESAKPTVLSQGEERSVERFSIGAALRSLVSNGSIALEGAEKEFITEGRKEAREAGIPVSNGIMLPRVLVRRNGFESRAGNALSATGTTSVTGDQGGMTIPLAKAGLLDDFFNGSVLRQAGATTLEGLSGKIDIPRLLQATAAAKKTENAAADATNPTTSMLSLLPKRLPAYVDIGEQLLLQSGEVIDQVVKRYLTAQLLATQETAFFHGTGTSESTGIAATAGIGSVAGGTNGLAPAWTHVVGLESKVDQVNALLGTPRYFINGKTRAQLKQTLKSATDTASNYIINGLEGKSMNGYDFSYTNAIASNLVKGSSGAICSALFFGNPADYWIGYWGGLHLEMLRDSANAILGQYRLAAAVYYDGGVARAQSFSAMLDALTALA